MKKRETKIKEVLRYTELLDWGSGNRDLAGWRTFNRAARLGTDPDVAMDLVVSAIQKTGGRIDRPKLLSQRRRAYERLGSHIGNAYSFPVISAQFDPGKLRKTAEGAPHVNEAWLASRSKIQVETATSEVFLESVFRKGEKVILFNNYRSRGQVVYEVGKTGQPIPSGPDGVWFLANPVDGVYHHNPRQEYRLSRRSEEAITSWRYLVIESDVADSTQWLACVAQLPLAIVAIYSSGGKSIHALVRLDAASKEEWDRIRNEVMPILVRLGADRNAMTAVRLTRLPGAMRGEQEQKLLYLNPEADGTPIVDQPEVTHAQE